MAGHDESKEAFTRVVLWMAKKHPEILFELVREEGGDVAIVVQDIVSRSAASIWDNLKAKWPF